MDLCRIKTEETLQISIKHNSNFTLEHMNQFLLSDRCIVEGCGVVTCCNSEAQNLYNVSQNLSGKIIKCCKGEIVGGESSCIQHKLLFLRRKQRENC